MINSLKDIPRIGEKTSHRLIEHFGSEKEALDSILAGDVASISEIEGISEKSAISLVLEALSVNEGVGLKDFLKTPEAHEIYEHLIELISDFAHTDHTKSKLHFYFPFPSVKKDRISALQKHIKKAMDMANDLENDDFSINLSSIRPIKTNFTIPVIRDRAIIASTQEEFEAAKKFPVSVQLVNEQGEVIDIARGYSHVIMGTGLAGFDFPEDIDIDFYDIKKMETWQAAPEKELAFFGKNHDSINAALSVFKIIRNKYPDFCSGIKDQEIERLFRGMAKILKDGDLRSGQDAEIDRMKSIYDRITEVISSAEKQANQEFGYLIEKSSITVKGFDLLTVMDGSINRFFEKEIKEKYSIATSNAARDISSRLGLKGVELQFNNFFSDEVTHPVRASPRGVEGLKNHLLRSIASRKLILLRENARELSKLKETASFIVRSVLDFDVTYTIGCFARKFDLSMPVIQNKNGIGFAGGRNLFLPAPVAIDYCAGNSHFGKGIDRNKDARIILLSGVNSGGKTTTLELFSQIIILAHMGFPVPAKQCEIGLVDEFFYFGKSKGTMDAGAFESTIKDFSAIAGKKSKIVLADELESITEPGASAKIISGILEEIENNNGLAVFVSHLGESILKNASCTIRVDGIEARGLDENLNLIVDRNPRYNYLARSTPELIVERLARKNNHNEFYQRLLRKFK
ncbi:MAG: endonuclease MutS2 [Candidatus Methanoperedens sp.]|nr:endonuclease MutS2 [Candidatus Methanoperedens sp.]MCE8429550.1 endonuclease MutS2 [Candidatus Methanoperedens sp.]